MESLPAFARGCGEISRVATDRRCRERLSFTSDDPLDSSSGYVDVSVEGRVLK